MSMPFLFTKRWWTPTLMATCKRKNRLAKESHHWCGLPDHDAYAQHQVILKEYTKLIESSKKDHWEDWLLKISERDLRTANKYITDPPPQMSAVQECYHCQEIGLVTFMFFLELLFSYVSFAISLYVSFANLFSIIHSLTC